MHCGHYLKLHHHLEHVHDLRLEAWDLSGPLAELRDGVARFYGSKALFHRGMSTSLCFLDIYISFGVDFVV